MENKTTKHLNNETIKYIVMKNGIKLTVAGILLSLGSFAQGSFGEIMGKMYEKSDSENPAYDATVWVEHAGAKIRSKVDMDGRFRISAVPIGKHKLYATYLGDTLKETVIASVKADGITNVGRINILEGLVNLEGVTVRGTKEPLIDFGDVGIRRISAEDIMLSPVRNSPKDLIISRNSDIKMDANGDLMIRGARAGDMTYFIDGVKMDDVKAIPSVAIGGMTVYSSAIPAKYGDTTGGVIMMETKSYHDLWRARKIMKEKAKRAEENNKKEKKKDKEKDDDKEKKESKTID